jgi:thiol peroxidase
MKSTPIFTNEFEPVSAFHIQMIQSHIKWSDNLHYTITRQQILDVETVARDDCCPLGKWLHSTNTKAHIGHLPRYQNCVKKHALFHNAAGQVALLVNEQKYDQALSELAEESEFTRTSIALIEAILPPLILDPISNEGYWDQELFASIETSGYVPTRGDFAPQFSLTNNKLENVTLASYENKCKIIEVIPSIDAPNCKSFVKHFNQKMGGLDNTVGLLVSGDLPFAQRRFLQIEGLNNIIPLSTFRSNSFAENYGLRITNGVLEGLLAHAIIVINEKGKIIYFELATDFKSNLDYDLMFTTLARTQNYDESDFHLNSDDKTPVKSQNRQYFRITVPKKYTLYCKIPLIKPNPNASEENIESYQQAIDLINKESEEVADKKQVHHHAPYPYMQLKINDLSSTGCSLVNVHKEFSHYLIPKIIYDNCIVVAPNVNEIKLSIEIISVLQIDKGKDGSYERIGIKFIYPNDSTASNISFIVTELERLKMAN